jgi:hypothetical protein
LVKKRVNQGFYHMKKIIAALLASTLAAPAFAGGLAEPVEPVVIPAEVTGGSLSTGAWIGLAAAAAVLIVVAASDDDDDDAAPVTPES